MACESDLWRRVISLATEVMTDIWLDILRKEHLTVSEELNKQMYVLLVRVFARCHDQDYWTSFRGLSTQEVKLRLYRDFRPVIEKGLARFRPS